MFLANRLNKPVLAEGPAGVGKTELAKAMAAATGRKLVRLQCYEGLDEAKALYEWNYRKQLLRISADPSSQWSQMEEDIFSEGFLLSRPLLTAISSSDPVVLLVDELDRVEMETEALLLEVLSEFQITIPELGTVRAGSQPLVILTSNNTRELSEALRRRCLFLHIPYPSPEREKAILLARCPDLPRPWPRLSPKWPAVCEAWLSRNLPRYRRPSTGPGRCSPWVLSGSTGSSLPILPTFCSNTRLISNWPARNWLRESSSRC